MPPRQIIIHLQPHFSVVPSALDDPNTSTDTRVPLPLSGLTSKISFERILEALKILLIVFEVSLRRISNTS